MAADAHAAHIVARAARWPLHGPADDELALDHRSPAELAAQLAALRAGLPAPVRQQAAAADAALEAGRTAAELDGQRELRELRERVLPERDREIARLRAELAEASREQRSSVMPSADQAAAPEVGALLSLAANAGTARDLTATLRCGVPIVADELHWEAVFAWVGEPLRCAAAKVRVGLGAGGFESASWQSALRPAGTADHVRLGGRAVWISDTAIAADPRMQNAARAGLATAALAPIGGIGVLEAFSTRYAPLHHGRLQALTAAAAWLGAVGRLHQRSERRRSAAS